MSRDRFQGISNAIALKICQVLASKLIDSNFLLQDICELIEANNEVANGTTLVHCVAGRSRSATLTVAYLLWKSGPSQTKKHKLYEIVDMVQKKRLIVQPNMGFMGQLVQWEEELKGNKKKKEEILKEDEKAAIKEIQSLIEKIKDRD